MAKTGFQTKKYNMLFVPIWTEGQKTQKHVTAIDLPGASPADKLPGRYSKKYSAKRGARRKLANYGKLTREGKSWLFAFKGKMYQVVFKEGKPKK